MEKTKKENESQNRLIHYRLPGTPRPEKIFDGDKLTKDTASQNKICKFTSAS